MYIKTKLCCSKCYQPLTSVTYELGTYVVPCACVEVELDEERYNEAVAESYERGYDDARQLKPMRM